MFVLCLREVEDWMTLPRDVKAAVDAKRVRRAKTLILKVGWDGLYNIGERGKDRQRLLKL
jgi:hypothetical protein